MGLFMRARNPSIVLLMLTLLTAACGGAGAYTPFIPPTAPASATLPGIVIYTPEPAPTFPPPTATSVPTPVGAPTPVPPCENNLRYVSDISVPDGTVFAPGAAVEKRWLVENSGSCNWQAGYTLRFARGFEMGAALNQPLFPALAGSQAEIVILFTAPAEPGVYRSEWQAYGPDDIPFGEPIFLEIIVQAP